MRKLLIISYDSVGDEAFPDLLRWPHFAALAKRSVVVREVSSVFLTNTYPIHASVVTGQPPAVHGLVSNTDPFPKPHPAWCFEASHLKAKTLWQAAAEKGLSTASVLWPVTGGAKEIRWNIPEILVLPGQHQVLENLKYGSKALQLLSYLRHHKQMRGIEQPQLDRFATSCMVDILQKKRPSLALMHLTAYDSLCHQYGPGSPALATAFSALDENLGRLLQALPDAYDVLLFSDHSQLAVHCPLLPNELLVTLGHLRKNAGGDYETGDCFFECCGGSAFFFPGSLSQADIEKVRSALSELPGFGRFLREDEMYASGRTGLPFGFCAQPGWCCEAYPSREKGNHGYPVEYDHYQVFYLAAGPHFNSGIQRNGGSLLDIAPLASALLQLSMPGLPPPRTGFLKDF